MSYNKPYFLVKGLESGKIETRRYYTIGGQNCRSFFPSKVRIDGKLENYQILNSESVPIWTYWQLQEIRDLAESINIESPDFEKEGINQDQLSFSDSPYLLKVWKKCLRYESFMANLKAILKNQFGLAVWQDWIDFGTAHQRMGWYIGMK